MTFATTGALTGTTGCQTFGTTYSVVGDAISIDPVIPSPDACDEALTGQAERFLAALGRVAAWRLDGPTLQLLDAGQLVVVTLDRVVSAAETASPAPSPSLSP